MSKILITNYLVRYSRAYQFADDVCRLVSNKQLKELLLAPKLAILEETIKDVEDIRKMSAGLPPELQFPDAARIISDEIKANIDKYDLIITNQSLVILCSLFESFLVECLEAILDSDPNMISKLALEKQISLYQIISLRDYGKVLSYFRGKILNAFSRAATEEQFRTFGRIGLTVSEFFDFANRPARIKSMYTGWDLRKLSSIFGERHDIVHNGKIPLNCLNDLHIREVYLEQVTWNISRQVGSKFKIEFDLPVT